MLIKMEEEKTKKMEEENLIQDKASESQVSEKSEVKAEESSKSSSNSGDNKKENKEKHISKKDKKLYEEIGIPEGITAEIEDDVLVIKKEGKVLKRKLNALIDIKIEDGKIILSAKRMRRTEKRLFGTFKAHVKNMIKGLTESFVYKLQVANVHFPMNVIYDKENNEIVVKNFLGEKKDRRIKLVDEVDVKVDKEIIEVSCFDIEKAGHSATKIEKGAKVRNKDRRIFQDGIFIIEKPGRVYL